MNFEKALDTIRKFGGTMYRRKNFVYCFKLNLETNTIYKIDIYDFENKSYEPAIFTSMDLMNDDWEVNLEGCWTDQ